MVQPPPAEFTENTVDLGQPAGKRFLDRLDPSLALLAQGAAIGGLERGTGFNQDHGADQILGRALFEPRRELPAYFFSHRFAPFCNRIRATA